jgi:hypothetical protein
VKSVSFRAFHFDFEEGSADGALAFATSPAVPAATAAALSPACGSAAATRRLLAESAANKPTFSSTQLVPTTETKTNERCAKSMPRRNQTRPLMRVRIQSFEFAIVDCRLSMSIAIEIAIAIFNRLRIANPIRVGLKTTHITKHQK